MRDNTIIFRGRFLLCTLFLCVAGWCMLTSHAGTAHAFFTSDASLTTTHLVEAFPTGLSAEAEGYRARGAAIDRSQLTVTAAMSDGTTRVLDDDEYELSDSIIASGYKGPFDLEASIGGGSERLSAPIRINVDEAYGAQYGDTLVFGRGIPAESYSGRLLSNTTWGIEEAGCSPRWNKGVLTTVVDIDRVSPVSLLNWFNNCSTMRTVVLDQMDTSRVTSLYYLFSGNTGMTTADVSRWDVSHVTTINRMFSSCTSLKSLDLSSWRTPSLTNTDLAFYQAAVLTSVGDLKGWDVSHVTIMNNMFDLCYKLKSLGDVSGWNTSNVTTMNYLFAGCEAISVDCRNWNVSKVVSHDYFDRDAYGVLLPRWS